MHATGYLEARPRHPVALVAAISINLAAVGVMLAYNPQIIGRGPDAITLTQFAPPPPIVPKPLPRTKAQQPRQADPLPMPQPVPIETPSPIIPSDSFPTAWPPMPPQPLSGNGEGLSIKPQPVPVEISAQIDGRYSNDLQPPYPAGLERAEIEGRATVRVQVGTDGRVLAVELVRADDPGFFNATRDQALRRWRFRPATRDGQPIVSWVTKTVVFRIARR